MAGKMKGRVEEEGEEGKGGLASTY